MKNKKPIGVAVISILEILIGLKLFFPFSIAEAQDHLLLLIISIFLVILGILTFQLKPIARMLNLLLSPLIAFLLYFCLLDIIPTWQIANVFIY